MTPSSRRLVLEYLWLVRLRIAAGVLLLAATNVLALFIPRLLKQAVDSMRDGVHAREIATYAGAIALVAIAQSLIRTWSRLAILGASRRVVYALRRRLFSHLQRLPMSFFRSRATGDIVSRAINDVMLIRGFYGPGVMNLVNTVFVYAGSVILMASMSPRLTLYAIAPYPLFAVAVNLMSRRVYARSLEVQEGLAAISNKAQENITGISLIKTYVREEAEGRVFDDLSGVYMRRNVELARARGVMIPLMGMMTEFGTFVVIVLGGAAVVRGEITLGDFVAFNAYLAFLMWPTFAFGWILNTFQRGLAAFRRIGEILDLPAEQREAAAADGADGDAGPFEGRIEIRGLTFAHPGAAPSTRHLEGLDLAVAPGEVLGILGTVGSGKSTLVGLLPGILKPPAGTIFIDGEDVTRIPLHRLRRHIAVVPQEPFLFSRSVRENVAYAPRGFDEEEILKAVEAARLARDIPAFPSGLDTVVGERGFTLSGGQRQRVTLARAILTRPSILVLDDPLSSVDAEVEEELLARLKETARGRTVILISNRIAALSWADHIVVMDAGRIVERGGHADLLKLGGLYASVARRQSLQALLTL
ncbi:MAG: ABC transporter ATP-binding protein [Acidobacteria bacterium]|nr:ABC transporter ATP-binding protein [Acidobacteriota bacterium]